MKKYVLILLTAVLLLCAASALAELPKQCPDCGTGFGDGWTTSADSRGHYCRCRNCGYLDNTTHVHATCEICGYATNCNLVFTHIDGTSQHRVICTVGTQEGTCPQGYAQETVTDCMQASNCTYSVTCRCGVTYPPLKHEPLPYVWYDDNEHYNPCRWYCDTRLNATPHTNVGGYCPPCGYIFNAQDDMIYLFGYEVGADIADIFVDATYLHFRMNTPTSYYIVEGDPEHIFDADPVRSGVFESGTQYWLLVQMMSRYLGETPEGGYRLNLPVSDTQQSPIEGSLSWVAFRLEPLKAVPTPTPAPAVPVTGDGADPTLWLAALILAAAGLLVLRSTLRKA